MYTKMGKKEIKRCLLVICAITICKFAEVLPIEASPSYYCYKVNSPIRIDGRLNERAWKDVPWIECKGLVDGLAPKYSTKAKMLWDEQHLYVSFNIEDPNVWAVVGKDTGEPREVWIKSPQARDKFIMCRDTFLKVYLDPDGDGKNYMEFHINPLNNINDWWLKQGSMRKDRQKHDFGPGNFHFEWDCSGLKSAVWVQGTLNNPKDTDKGWSVEMAFPWESLDQFTLGKCPPVHGDVWRVHLGRAYKPKIKAKRTYWTWPVIGVLDCHQLDRYGFVIFSEDSAIKKKSIFKKRHKRGQLLWKMVWLWTMRDKSDAEIVALAKSLGFNAIQARSKNMVEACHKVGMEAIAALWFGSAPEEFTQQIGQDDEKRFEIQVGEVPLHQKNLFYPKSLYQSGGEPIIGGEIHESNKFWCLNRPEALEYGKRKIDKVIAEGYDGIGLDAIGYRNYYACFCPVCRMKQKEFRKEHPEIPLQEAIYRYSEKCLVSFYSALVNYAKEKKPNIRITCHIYPHFAPNPLYGNKLPVDYCGQTVSWFFKPHWSLEKVEHYTKIVVEDESLYHQESIGAPFIAFYSKGKYAKDVRTAERIRQEIQIIKRTGAKAIQFAELGNILNDPGVAKVVSEELGGTWKSN